MNIGFISLGCAKANYDSERLINRLQTAGYGFTDRFEKSDVIIINTCGFIEDAIAESLAAIENAITYTDQVIVTGCLGANAPLIKDRFPQIIGITGPAEDDKIMDLLPPALDNNKPQQRLHLTPRHYSWLKIAEGCNQSCSFCVIPSMRGKLTSRNLSTILREAQNLVADGVKEILIVAQDTAAYGVDVKYRRELVGVRMLPTNITTLATELGQLGVWVRLHYLYPYPILDELVALMQDKVILPYLDIPLQHASPRILKTMRRPANMENMQRRIEAWRNICPDLSLRTTLICGFPGETVQDFDILHDFVSEIKFNRLGVLPFSPIAGAPASGFADQIDDEIKEIRHMMLLDTQEEISAQLLKKRIGEIETVLVDEVEGDTTIGRSKYDAPEVDGVVKIKNAANLNPGDWAKVIISAADNHNLVAKVIGIS